MLRIDKNIKTKRLPNYISQQLYYVKTDEIRSSVCGMTYILIDLLIILPLLSPFIPIYVYLIAPPLLLLHGWNIRILIKNPYSVQFETLLYIAALSLAGMFSFFLIAQKIAYFYADIKDGRFYFINTMLYLAATIGILFYRLNKFKNLSYETLIEMKKAETAKEKKRNRYDSLLYAALCLGVATIRFMRHGGRISNVFAFVCFWGLALFFSYTAIKFIHRILFIRANIERAPVEIPSKKEFKKGIVKRDMKIK